MAARVRKHEIKKANMVLLKRMLAIRNREGNPTTCSKIEEITKSKLSMIDHSLNKEK
jgi:hypothetical protein